MEYRRNIMGSGKSGIRILPLSEVVMSADELRDEEERTREAQRIADEERAKAPQHNSSNPVPDSNANSLSSKDIPLVSIESGKPESYIILPAGNYGGRDYPDLLIGMNRISYTDKRVQNAAGKLYPQQQFSDNDRGFMGGINHQQALDITRELGGFTLSVLLEREFIRNLKKGIDTNFKVFDGSGKRVASNILSGIYDEILKVQNPWRSEWNADRFSNANGTMNTTTYIFDNENLKEVTELLSADYLVQNKQVKLIDWINKSTVHGLPLADCKDGSFYYWAPVNGSVVGFGAGSGGAGLDCGRSPTNANSSLGVREARKKF